MSSVRTDEGNGWVRREGKDDADEVKGLGKYECRVSGRERAMV